jgi:catechol 2,3-dioxygenase-like lactoylglutathione lyase family enzyme
LYDLQNEAKIFKFFNGQSWLRKFEQGDKWSFCLTAGTLWPANQERPCTRGTKFYESLFGPSSGNDSHGEPYFRLRTGAFGLTTYGVNPVGVDHFCVSVEGYEPDAVSEKLKQNGIPSQRLYGPNHVFVRDPDGILVQLA